MYRAKKTSVYTIVSSLFSTLFAMTAMLVASPIASAACTAPGTDYGTVTHSNVSITSAGTYRIWTRMAAPSASANTFLLEIDGGACYTVGGSSVPVYTNGSTTRFVSNTSNWISKTSGGANIDVNFTVANHTLKLIGNADGVVVDRIVLTKDVTCTPTGDGSNCATIYLAADIDQSGKVDFLDFSRLAAKYNQSGGSLGRTDINNDGTVNFLDFSLMASTYGQ